jgi:hypothetical protein
MLLLDKILTFFKIILLKKNIIRRKLYCVSEKIKVFKKSDSLNGNAS